MRAVSLFSVLSLLALSPAARPEQARDDRWRQDLTFLSSELPARHGNLFFLLSRTEFQAAVGELMQAIPELSDEEVVTGMARIVAMAGDAHTSISLTQTAAGFQALPISLYWHRNGLYVRSAASHYKQALGARVLAIGDKTVDEAYRLVSAVISHENDYWVRVKSPSYLVLPSLLRALRIISGNAPVRFTLERTDGQRISIEVEHLPAVEWVTLPDTNDYLPLASREEAKAYWYTYLEDSRTLYFKYNRCAEMPAQPFAGFAADLFAVFDSRPVDRLVTDLRNNGGGSTAVLEPFLRELQARLARFSTTRHYVLFNRGTFSSAMLNALSLKNTRDQNLARGVPREQTPVFLGEPTGGNPTVPWRNGGSFSLPNSRLLVSYTTTVVSIPYRPEGAVDPDVMIPIDSYDQFARHDPVLAAVFADSSGEPEEAASTIAVLNAASLRPGPVAPGSLASALGDFAAVEDASAPAGTLPEQLAETQLIIDTRPARLLSVGPAQINFQVPHATPVGKVEIQAIRRGEVIASGVMNVRPAGPGLFSADLRDPARPGAILNSDNTVNSATTPARPSDEIRIYATGQGGTTPAVRDGEPGPAEQPAHSELLPRVFIGHTPAEVRFSGLSAEHAGVWLLIIRLPATLAPGQYPVFVLIDGVASGAVTVWIGRP